MLFFAIKLWVQIAHKFMIIFCHKLVPKICINLWQKIQKFFDSKENHKNTAFFCHKFMGTNCP